MFLSLTFRTRHEALQKLAIFFQHGKGEFGDIPDSGGATPTKYSTLLSITSTTTVLKVALLSALMSYSKSVNSKCFHKLKPVFPLYPPYSIPQKVMSHQVSLQSSFFFHDCTVVTTYVTLTDNGEAKRRVLINLFKDTTVSTLASCL